MKTAEERREGYPMPINTERREVARRLRTLATHREVDKYDVEDAIGLYMGECVDGYDPVSVADLADLIEPSEADEWVDGLGGLGAVQAMYDALRDMLDWVKRSAGIGEDECIDYDELLCILDRRLMPEGMEWLLEVWPKWSNGEYCKFGDWWTADKYGEDEPQQLRRLAFYTPEQLRMWEQDEGDNFGYEWDFMRPSDTTYRPDKAEPPAPKVLAADGEPLEVGQTVYSIETGDEYTVYEINLEYAAPVAIEKTDYGYSYATGEWLTHQRPVLDADGVPIHGGDTVWGIDGGLYRVTGANDGEVFARHIGGSFGAEVESAGGEGLYRLRADQLTHTKPEPPDSWERVESDATLPPRVYCERRGIAVEQGDSFVEPMVRDLVRRARMLAERRQ